MKHIIFIIIFLLINIQKNFAKNDSLYIANNILYLEVAGIGGYGSINFERVVLRKNNLMLGVRLGVSTYHVEDYTNEFNPDIIIPFSVNGCYGRNHKIELDFGETFTNIVHADQTDFTPVRISGFHTNLSIGYRYQKNNGGIFFRCTYTPILEFNEYFRQWAGASVGYSF